MSGMVSLDDLRLFAVVARHSSFIDAARRTGVPTSTVSRRVAALETSVGARLLQRTSRRVGLTKEGARLLERSAPLLDALVSVADMTAERDDEPKGVLRVTAPVFIGSERIAPALFAFAARHPKVALELTLTNAVVPLIDERYDLAFRVGSIREADLSARKLWPIPQALAASPAFVRRTLKGKTLLERNDLDPLPGILTRPRGSWRFRRRDGTVEEVRPSERLTVNDPRVAIAAAVQGLGVVAAPIDTIEQHGKALVRLEVVARALEPREIYAVYPARRPLPGRVRLALDFVIAHQSSAKPP